MVSNSEMDRRWKLVRNTMIKEDLDWLICGVGQPGGYAKWLSNRSTQGSAAIMNCIAFPVQGDMYFATHGDTVHSTPVDSYGVKHLVSPCQPNLLIDTLAPVVLDVLKPSRPKKIGFLGMGFIPASAHITFTKEMPDVKFIDATNLIAPIKAVKSSEELVFMKHAAAMHELAVDLIIKTVKPGRTANDIAEELKYNMRISGSQWQNIWAGSAPPGTICKYAGQGERKIMTGDQFAVLIEFNEPEGYFCEMMPTVCIGKVPEELQRVFNDAIEAQKILLDMARPGADPMDMLKANDMFMQKKGYPPEKRLAGHSQGIDLVERPALSPVGETIKLETNMVIALHPTVHGNTAWGYPINQVFQITDDGPLPMTKARQEIIVL